MSKLNPSKLELIYQMMQAAQDKLIKSNWIRKNLMREIKDVSNRKQGSISELIDCLLYNEKREKTTSLELQLEICARINSCNYLINSFAKDDLFEECKLVRDYLDQLELIYLAIITDHFAEIITEDDVAIIEEFRAFSFAKSKEDINEND